MMIRKLLLCTSLLTWNSAAWAQTSPTDDIRNGDIIVTAQKRAERLQDVPLTIVAQTAEQLEAAGVATTKDLTKVVPGLVFAQNEAFSQPSIRGVTTTVTSAGAESPTAIYLDGVYQPSMNGVLFDLPDVERIEVLKGPQGTLFGRNATGGAIQIFTRKPTYDTSGKITLSDGIYTGGHIKTAHEITASGYVSSGLVPDQLAASLSGYFRHNNGFMVNDFNGRRSGKQETYGIRGQLMWEPSTSTRILLAAYYNHLDDQQNYDRAPYRGITLAASFPDAIVPTRPWHVSLNPDRPNFLKLKAYGASLRADFDTGIGTFTSITGYSRSKNMNFVDSRGAYSTLCQAAPSANCQLFNLGVNSEAVTEELNFVSNQFGIASLTAGLFYYHNFGATQHVDIFQGAGGDLRALTYDAKVITSSYAAFAELNLNPIDRLHIILGGRINYEKAHAIESVQGATSPISNVLRPPTPVATPEIDDTSFTPRLSIRYEFNSRSNVYFTFSKGFKTGILPPPTQAVRQIVEPEKLTSYEVGLKTASRNWGFNAAYYHYDYTNLQLTSFVGGLAFPQNAGKARIEGFDVDGRWSPTDDIDLTIAFNYTPTAKYKEYLGAPLYLPPPGIGGTCPAGFTALRATAPCVNPNGDASGLRMIRVPKFTGSIGASWSHDYAFGKVGASANVYHSSSMNWDILGVVKTDPYEDVSGQLFLERNGMRFSIFGKNLLNKAAIAGSQPSSQVIPVLYIPPRQIGASVSYAF